MGETSNLSYLASRALRAAAVGRGEALDAKCFSLAVENIGRVAALGMASNALFSPPMTPSLCFSAQRRQFQPHAHPMESPEVVSQAYQFPFQAHLSQSPQ
jgi:hypothetical protein